MPKAIPSKTTLPISLLKEAQMINIHKWSYPGMQIYKIQEDIIDKLFRSPSTKTNCDADIVYLKVSTLNLYYSTFMQATRQMANGINDIGIDSRLISGDVSLVEEIATKTTRRNYSFATKYCACHQPEKFPIYDNLVGSYLAKVAARGNIVGFYGARTTLQEKMKKDYEFYKNLYDAFIQQYDLIKLSYREVDWYLWTANKCLKSAKLNMFTLI